MSEKLKKDQQSIWLDTLITLSALMLMAYFYYGSHIVFVGTVCAVVSLIAEIICLRLMHREFSADDLSCTADALITVLMLPASIDLRTALSACIFGVIVAKNALGGRMNTIFPPSAVSYLFAYTSWKSQVLTFPEPNTQQDVFEKSSVLVNSASHVFNTTGRFSYSDFDILMGNFSGGAGTVSILILIISALILVFRKDISAGAFFGTLFGTAFTAYLVPLTDDRLLSVKYALITNTVLFSAVYIVSDRRTNPERNVYSFFYGLLTGTTSYIITVTTAKENAVVLVCVLLTPIALALKNLERKIELADTEQLGKEAVSVE